MRGANAEIAETMFKVLPLKRIGTRDDLVGAVVYLLSDSASYTKGADIAFTEGLHVRRQIDT